MIKFHQRLIPWTLVLSDRDLRIFHIEFVLWQIGWTHGDEDLMMHWFSLN
jgi:hypothetical protein